MNLLENTTRLMLLYVTLFSALINVSVSYRMFESNLAKWTSCHSEWLKSPDSVTPETMVNLGTCIAKNGFAHGNFANETYYYEDDCEITFSDPLFEEHNLPFLSLTGEKPVVCPPPIESSSLIHPFTSFPYELSPLLLSVGLRGRSNNKTCSNLSNVKISAWHSNSSVQQIADVNSPPNCFGWSSTNNEGKTGFISYFPASIGPPQHLFLSASAEGYHSLTSAYYFDSDPWMQYLTGFNTEIESLPNNIVLNDRRMIHVSLPLDAVFVNSSSECNDDDDDFSQWKDLSYQNVINGLTFARAGELMTSLHALIQDATSSQSSTTSTHFACLLTQPDYSWLSKARFGHVDIVLEQDSEMKMSEMNGFWSTQSGVVHSHSILARDILSSVPERTVPISSDIQEEIDQIDEVIHFLSNLDLTIIESRHDVVVIFSEYPLSKEWGSMVGLLKGSRIEKITFPGLIGANVAFPESIGVIREGIIDSDITVDENGDVFGSRFISWNDGQVWQKIDQTSHMQMRFMRLTFAKTLCSNAVSTSLPIELQKSGCLDINEIVFLSGQGIPLTTTRPRFADRHYLIDPSTNLRYYSHPLTKLTGSDTPQLSRDKLQGEDGILHSTIKCSHNQALLFPCWKAFDGELSLDSKWSIGSREFKDGLSEKWSYFIGNAPSADDKEYTVRSGGFDDLVTSSAVQEMETRDINAGSKDLLPNLLSNQPTWIEIDLGESKGIIPTGVAIYCGSGVMNQEEMMKPTGCPRDFTLYGSNDGKKYFKIYRKDQLSLADFNSPSDSTETEARGLIVHFLKDSRQSKINGQVCGSCESYPTFSCSTNSIDLTCKSSWCNEDGKCGESKLSEISRERKCKGGFYGVGCSSECPAGYHCPIGNLGPVPCTEKQFYCPMSSAKPVAVSSGFFTQSISSDAYNGLHQVYVSQTLCDAGMYCIDGKAKPCPIGRFGQVAGLNSPSCSGSCPTGTYCNARTIVPIHCPIGFFCESGKLPTACPAGRYGDREGLQSSQCSGFCQPGYFCPPNSTNSNQIPCPAGRFGESYELKDAQCSGDCPEGFFCPEGSTFDNQKCGGSDVYCPKNSGHPIKVSSGWYSTGGRDNKMQTNQAICESGSFCSSGVKYACNAGRYGNESGLEQDPNYSGCSGACPKAHFCPISTIVPIKCPAGRYGGDYSMTNSSCSGPCHYGHYCKAGSSSNRQNECPAGRFGGSEGLKSDACSTECDGDVCKKSYCDAGFYCREGSTTPQQSACGGPKYFCPIGSSSPQAVREGYYTVRPSDTAESQPVGTLNEALIRVKEVPCEPGHYCIDGSRLPCPSGRYGSDFMLSSENCSGPCRNGSYCMELSTWPDEKLCPAGRYGRSSGLKDILCSGECEIGHYCPLGSTSPTELPCNSSNRYCPESSGFPMVVRNGWFSTGGNWTTRSEQSVCEVGTYCNLGIQLPCPAGRYGSNVGLSSPNCSGACYSGYYCPVKSTKPNQTPCPLGTYGPHEGQGSIMDCLPCPDPAKCLLASILADGSIPSKFV